MDFALQLGFSGIITGGVYSLIALGFVLIYESANVFKFAQGQLGMAQKTVDSGAVNI
jgi:branched-chain amino acid transport system permease protein